MEPFETPDNNPIVETNKELVHPLRKATIEEIQYEQIKQMMNAYGQAEISDEPCRVCGSEFKEDDVVLLDTDFEKKCMFMLHSECAYIRAKEQLKTNAISKQ